MGHTARIDYDGSLTASKRAFPVAELIRFHFLSASQASIYRQQPLQRSLSADMRYLSADIRKFGTAYANILISIGRSF